MCSEKKAFLEILQISQENPCARVSFLIELRAEVCNLIKKETLTQVFFCEFCEISKKTFSYRTTPVAASRPFLHEMCYCTILKAIKIEISSKRSKFFFLSIMIIINFFVV